MWSSHSLPAPSPHHVHHHAWGVLLIFLSRVQYPWTDRAVESPSNASSSQVPLIRVKPMLISCLCVRIWVLTYSVNNLFRESVLSLTWVFPTVFKYHFACLWSPWECEAIDPRSCWSSRRWESIWSFQASSWLMDTIYSGAHSLGLLSWVWLNIAPSANLKPQGLETTILTSVSVCWLF